MPRDPRRAFSDHISAQDVDNLREAIAFADAVGYPLTLSIDVNWTRTSLGDDPDGHVLDKLMELSRKWLKYKGIAIFAWVAVRECPNNCPNTHVMVHCPVPLRRTFRRHVLDVLRRECRNLHQDAVVFRQIGRGNPTLKAAQGKLDYIAKGVDPNVAERFGIAPKPQGRINGRRISISQDIHRAARQRHMIMKEQIVGTYVQELLQESYTPAVL